MKKIILAASLLICFGAVMPSVSAKGKWKPLFGKNLAEAQYNPEVWSEKDGVLTAVKDESIWTKQEYENFEMELEFKTDDNTNSGVVVYCTDKQNWIPNSVEIQIADDYGSHFVNADKKEKCAAIYSHLAPVKDNVVKKPGEWNKMKVVCKGRNIVVTLNGKKVTDMDMTKWTSGKTNPDGSSIHGWLPQIFSEIPTKGFIGLQGKHGSSGIWFRNMKIRQL